MQRVETGPNEERALRVLPTSAWPCRTFATSTSLPHTGGGEAQVQLWKSIWETSGNRVLRHTECNKQEEVEEEECFESLELKSFLIQHSSHPFGQNLTSSLIPVAELSTIKVELK